MLLIELQTPQEVNALQANLTQMMRPVGLTVAFSRHFNERVLQRERRTTIEQITRTLEKVKRKFKKRLLKAKKASVQSGQDYEAVVKDYEQNLVVIFKIQGDLFKIITIKTANPDDFGTDNHGGDILKV